VANHGNSGRAEIKRIAIEEAELGEWEDDPPEVVSFEILEEP
jgi:hypothetical protein